jgi:hypothetical protein
MRNRFLGFVAHVGEPEGLAFELAVASIDHEMMFLAQIALEFRDIDPPRLRRVFNTGEGDGATTFNREKLKAAIADPLMDERVRALVPLVTIRQAFGENLIEL